MNNDLNKTLEVFPKNDFKNNLVDWFLAEQRDLPWRKNKDPYRVWVSEIMLQQTRVDTVIPFYNKFMQNFPTIADLANAEEEKVLKAWEGLGYYSRARNLQSAVREVHVEYAGKVPDTPELISKLKGVGPYTAGAILSIAYGKPEPAVDGNVMRVLSRILTIWEDIGIPKNRKIFEQAVRALISYEDPSAFNQGLMELGALICTPTNPACLLCPVREQCKAFETGVVNELPIKSKKKAPKPINLAVGVIKNRNNQYLIQQRPSSGLLANMWEFPTAELQSTILSKTDTLRFFLNQELQLEVEELSYQFNIEHVFSHLVWKMDVYIGNAVNEGSLSSNQKWVTLDECKELPFPVVHQKIYQQIEKLL
ncbi:A/G-specific adenine glycosylase [Bacillus sp. AFS055030]|uniref:A/G-specific adenine glycosylase n=1 Tax=Bacillus sp. AFS055030 TaxID=2033507 RepID=UPI000BFDC8D1|nr:A/G-specific adenine glycosylase [Bacillus sp. AFS055030]PGL70426.1 A/G-specific adenine glycosylase [Bacillus sp. AFS055030]